MFTSPQMGLVIWNSPSDPFDSGQLANNLQKVDQHDHTPGKGVLIPTGGIADGAVTQTKLGLQSVGLAQAAPDLIADYSRSDINPKVIVPWSGGSFVPNTTNQWWIYSSGTDPAQSTSLQARHIFYWDPSMWFVGSGGSLSWTLRSFLSTNDVTPTSTTHFKLSAYPINFGEGFPSSPVTYTYGVGTQIMTNDYTALPVATNGIYKHTTVSAPAAAGLYTVAMESSAAMNSGSILDIRYQLELALA